MAAQERAIFPLVIGATVKTTIVRLALWGFLPASFAQRLINFLDLRGA